MGFFNLPSIWLSRTGYAVSVSHPGLGLTGPALIAAVPGDLPRVRAPDIGANPERNAQPDAKRGESDSEERQDQGHARILHAGGRVREGV